MKKIILIIFILLFLTSCKTETYEGVTPVYVTFYSHNEETWDKLIKNYEDYQTYRENLIERVDIIKEYNATLNWQTDHTVLELMIEYENPELMEITNNKNILRYMSEDKEIFIDPHTHLFNLADIAYLIEELGVQPSEIVGGTRFRECTEEGSFDFISWHDEILLNPQGSITGLDYDYTWKPKILTVPGIGGHFFDEMSTGIWKPGDNENFYEHSDSNPLIYIGQGNPHYKNTLGDEHASGALVLQEDGEYIIELIEKIKNEELEPGKLYTASIHLRDNIQSDAGANTNEGLTEILEVLQPYVDEGSIIYKDYETIASLWLTEYEKETYTVSYENFKLYEENLAEVEEYCSELSTNN